MPLIIKMSKRECGGGSPISGFTNDDFIEAENVALKMDISVANVENKRLHEDNESLRQKLVHAETERRLLFIEWRRLALATYGPRHVPDWNEYLAEREKATVNPAPAKKITWGVVD
jgi:hypothetical protein